MRVAIVDESTSGERSAPLTVQFLTERVTVRELIHSRVYQEVSEHNARNVLGRPRLVEPSDAENLLNGPPRRVDWERQFERALNAFAGNRFLLFVGERQLVDLDEEVLLEADAEVTFLRLVPLVGG